MLSTLANLFGQIGTALFLIGVFVLWPLMWPITGRYFDNHVGLKNIENKFAEYAIGPRGLLRTLEYALLIVTRRARKTSPFRKMFGNLNFREAARNIDKVLAFLFFIFTYGGIALLLAALLFHGIKKLLG